MSTSVDVAYRRYGLFACAILLLLLGGAGVYFGSENFLIRALGSAATIASVYVARISRNPIRSRLADTLNRTDNELAKTLRRTDNELAKGPGRVLWGVSIALVPLLGISWLLLNRDAVNGGHEVWPVDVFAGVGLVCTLVWSFLAAKIVGRSLGKN